MARILTITPNPLLDFIAQTSLDSGAVNRVDSFRMVVGGKAINASRVLARHGHDVTAIGFAGGFAREPIHELLKSDGMNPVLTPTKARTRIGFEAIGARGATTLLENGFDVTPQECRSLVDEVCARLPSAALVLVGGSVPCGSCQDLFTTILSLAAEAGIPCWLDSYGTAMHRALSGKHLPAVTKPNLDEFHDGKDFSRCPEVHVTDGPRTFSVRGPQGRFRVTPPRVREVNAIGSGDCYLAALAHARILGQSIEAQLRYAAAAGAANAALGANTYLAPADIEPFVAQVAVERET